MILENICHLLGAQGEREKKLMKYKITLESILMTAAFFSSGLHCTLHPAPYAAARAPRHSQAAAAPLKAPRQRSCLSFAGVNQQPGYVRRNRGVGCSRRGMYGRAGAGDKRGRAARTVETLPATGPRPFWVGILVSGPSLSNFQFPMKGRFVAVPSQLSQLGGCGGFFPVVPYL